MKKIILFSVIILIALVGCGKKETATTNGSTEGETGSGLTEIKFDMFFTKSETGEGKITDEMMALNGKKVGIMGYMTELTPIDNRFIYLVPTAGAACPFCSAENPKYMEAIAVYPPNGEKFEFTQEGLWAYGTLEVGEEVDPATGLISMFRLKAESIEPYQAR